MGPKGSETIYFKDLKKKRETLEIPIPTVVDEEDGTFQIDLVSVEDSYGCRKELSVPGISVNVRRVKACHWQLPSVLQPAESCIAFCQILHERRWSCNHCAGE